MAGALARSRHLRFGFFRGVHQRAHGHEKNDLDGRVERLGDPAKRGEQQILHVHDHEQGDAEDDEPVHRAHLGQHHGREHANEAEDQQVEQCGVAGGTHVAGARDVFDRGGRDLHGGHIVGRASGQRHTAGESRGSHDDDLAGQVDGRARRVEEHLAGVIGKRTGRAIVVEQATPAIVDGDLAMAYLDRLARFQPPLPMGHIALQRDRPQHAGSKGDTAVIDEQGKPADHAVGVEQRRDGTQGLGGVGEVVVRTKHGLGIHGGTRRKALRPGGMPKGRGHGRYRHAEVREGELHREYDTVVIGDHLHEQ